MKVLGGVLMARKQKLLKESSAHLTVLQQEAKFKAETIAADGSEPLQKVPPRHLQGAAKQEYKRIYKALGKLPLRNLDRAELENYCTWYQIYKNCSEGIPKVLESIDAAQKAYDNALDELNQVRATGSKTLIKEATKESLACEDNLLNAQGQYNMIISRLDKATKQIKGLASDLGLNVNSRLQMNMPKNNEKEGKSILDKFA